MRTATEYAYLKSLVAIGIFVGIFTASYESNQQVI